MALPRSQLAKLHAEEFRRAFGPSSELVCTAIAPGRVNLIGEHVDHQLYPVCPVAISQTTRVSIGYLPSDARGTLLRLEHEKGHQVFRSLELITLEGLLVQQGVEPRLGWVNYIIAAVFGVLEYTVDPTRVGTLIDARVGLGPHAVPEEKDGAQSLTPQRIFTILTQGKPVSLCIFVSGDVPMAAGVSSSSALLVASMAALFYTLNLGPIKRSLLAEISCKAERHAGMAGGGMDQAVICLARKNSALHVGFEPLSVEHIPLPRSAAIVVCNSGVQAAKTLTLATGYNKRVVELKLGAFLIMRGAKSVDLSPSELAHFHLRDLQSSLQCSPKELQALAERHISPYPILKSEVEEILGTDRVRALSGGPCGPEVWSQNVNFEPLRRVLHVCSEVQRVAEFVRICVEPATNEKAQLRALGRLLDASGKSLARQFDCSTPELEDLTEICRHNGAFGARLTGAGWGGCIMALVHRDQVDDIFSAIRTKYFERQDRSVPISVPYDLKNALFVVTPDDGLELFDSATGSSMYFD